MSVSTAADPSGRFQILTIHDVYSIDQWREAMDALLASPVFLATCAVVVDRRDAAPPTTSFVNHIIEFYGGHAERLGSARFAIATSDAANFGMARMKEMKADRLNPTLSIHAFHTYKEAVAWLTSPPTVSDAKNGDPEGA
jgi:hypothetical protein